MNLTNAAIGARMCLNMGGKDMRIKAIQGATKVEIAVATIVNDSFANPINEAEGIARLRLAATAYFKAHSHLFDLVNDGEE